MSGDKRSVSTDALETLGTIIDEGAGRDAIHIAVEPCVAGETLSPGQHIGQMDGIAFSQAVHVGIVDPFLPDKVKEGEWFWLLVYPRKITSLRHVWSHPAFRDTSHVSVDKAKSEAWLRTFCENSDCPDYERVIAAALNNEEGYGDYNDGEYILFRGTDARGTIPDEFWDHVEIVTGKKIMGRATYFTCSC